MWWLLVLWSGPLHMYPCGIWAGLCSEVTVPAPECNCAVRNRCQFWTILCCPIFHFRLHRAFTRDLFFILFTDFCKPLWLFMLFEYEQNYHGDTGRFPFQSLYGNIIFLFWWTVQTMSFCPPAAEGLRIIICRKPNQMSGVILIMYAWWLA